MKRLITIMLASACFFVLNAQEKSEDIRTITVDDAVAISLISNYSIDDCLKFKDILESNLN